MRFLLEFLREMKRAAFSLKMHVTMRNRMKRLRARSVQHPVTSGATSHRAGTLTIVVPCYGHGSFLRTMITSIAAQTVFPSEVIFVNDNSPDATLEILESCIVEFDLRSHTRCMVLNNERNLGQAASLNIGIEAATSDVVMVLNDDDYLLHDAVAVTLEVLRLRPHIHMFGGQCILFEDDQYLQLFNKELLKVWSALEIPMKEFHPTDTLRYEKANDLNITHSGCSFYKNSWREVGGYYADKSKRVIPYSDRDFQLRFNLRFPIAVLDVPISFWRSSSSVDAGVNS
jgi:glycosyltransferase involved in cell wall biosynthesis